MIRYVLAALLAGALLVLSACLSDTTSPARPHVVLIVFDELPTDALLGPGGRIDALRYPSFAALARDATWFRNGHSSYDSTTKAVPLVLDGLAPRPGTAPDRAGHPRSLVDMFRREGYRMVASEEATALCPPSMCLAGNARRPAILPNLAAGRPERFERFVRSIGAGPRPTFWWKHVLLPHGPYMYLPSGARSRPRPRDLLPGMTTTPGFHDEFLTRHNEQRFLLQLGFTDRLLGRLLRRLKGEGIYDDTLLVVVADHGISWKAGVTTRRRVSRSNVAELAPVPFFVKRPGQRRGTVSNTYASALDVAPTIADALGSRLGYRSDGSSAFGATARARRVVSLTTRDFTSTVRISGGRWRALRRDVVRRRLRQFGSGAQRSLYTGIGPNRELLGRRTAELPRAAGPGRNRTPRGTLAQAGLFAGAIPGIVPNQIAGDLRGGTPGARRDLAVAVNGRIEAVGHSFHLLGDPVEHFSLMVPERSLAAGPRRIAVFEVVAGRMLRPLVRN